MISKRHQHTYRFCAFLLSICVAAGSFASQDAMIMAYAGEKQEVLTTETEGGTGGAEAEIVESPSEPDGTDPGTGESPAEPDSPEPGTGENPAEPGSPEPGTGESPSEPDSPEPGTGESPSESDGTQEENGEEQDTEPNSLSGNAALSANGIYAAAANAQVGTDGYTRIPGSSLEWKYSAGTLSVLYNDSYSGTAAIPDASEDLLPWNEHKAKVTKITIGTGVTAIGSNAFSGYEKLTSLTLGKSIVDIGAEAFADCVLLTSVQLPEKLETLGNKAFYNCKKLKTVSIKNYLKSIGAEAFKDCAELTGIKLPNTVTDMGEYAFYGNAALASLTLSTNLTAVPDYAFYGCTALKTVSIPAKVKSIGKYAFYNCEKITTLTMSDNVETLGEYAFANCKGIKTASLSGALVKIESSVFYNCAALTQISIPNNVKSIGNNAFQQCTSLVSISLPSDLESLGSYAFEKCEALVNVSLPGKLSAIPKSAFSGCKLLKSVYLPEGIQTIGEAAFSGCGALQSITIPESVTTIEKEAFSNCAALTELDLKNTEVIGEKAFYRCSKVKTVLMDKATEIGKEGFAGCSVLKAVMLPATLKLVNDYAFRSCKEVKTLILFSGSAQITVNAFSGMGELDTLALAEGVTVGSGSLPAYLNAKLTFRVEEDNKANITAIMPVNENVRIIHIPNLLGIYTVSKVSAVMPGATLVGCEFKGETPANVQKQSHNYEDSICTRCKIKRMWTIVFHSVSENEIEPFNPITAKYGSTIELPNPTKEGYTFKGWFNAPMTQEEVEYFQYTNQTILEVDETEDDLSTELVLNLHAHWSKDQSEGTLSIGDIPNQTYTGKEIKPVVNIFDNNVKLLSGKDFTLSYKNNVKVGKATVTITGKGNYSSTNKKTLEFNIVAKKISDADIKLTISDVSYTGAVIKPALSLKWDKVTLKSGTDYKIGDFKPENPVRGKVTFNIYGIGKYQGIRMVSYNIYEGYIGNAIVDKIPSQPYNPDGAEPVLKVRYKIGNKTQELNLNSDYKVTYVDNKDRGKKATATITGVTDAGGGYRGTKTVIFTITQRDISKGSDILVQAIANQQYTGTAIKPLPVVSLNGTLLKKDVDYILSWSNNTKAASITSSSAPTVTIKGKGNYKGSLKVKFTISPEDLTDTSKVSAVIGGAVYNKGKEVLPQVTLVNRETNQKLIKDKDYVISASNNKEKGEQAIATVVGKGNYKGILTENFNITDATIGSAAVKVEPQEYGGGEVRPTCTVTYKGSLLSEGKDYRIAGYTNNAKPGKTAAINIVGMGAYAGAKTVNFTINAKSLGNEEITAELEGVYPYTGTAIKPEPTVKKGTELLEKDKDYTLSWGNNVKAAANNAEKAPYITIKGKGNYSGSRTLKFTIETRGLAEAAFTVSDMQYNGKYLTPSIKAVDNVTGKNVTLKNKTDYVILECGNNLNYETPSMTEEQKPFVVIEGRGNYAGEQLRLPFRIYQYNIAKASVSAITAEMYTGTEIRPDAEKVKVSYGGAVLQYGSEYDLVYTEGSNISVGTGSVNIVGKGAYGGTKKATFKILPKFIWNIFY